MTPRDLNWWIAQLDQVKKVSDGYTALCPGHDDLKGSLHLSVDSTGIVVHCFAGCTYQQILDSIEGKSEKRPSPKVTVTSRSRKNEGPANEWWASYTGIPWGEWEEWGAKSNQTGVEFTWRSSNVIKKRLTGQKVFVWEPENSATPPLWPEPEGSLPRRIWITEGESDCGVLRHVGLAAFAITKGVAGKRVIQGIWSRLQAMGVSEVVLAFDQDEPGQKGIQEVSSIVSSEGLRSYRLSLSQILNPLLGEKDLRDLWLRYRDIVSLRRVLEESVEEIRSKSDLVTVDQFLASNIRPSTWLVDQIWLSQAIGMIVGSPKMGKSWLALDIALSVSAGVPFLGTFEVPEPGPVVLLTKEDPDHLLQDRLEKINISKGLGGTFQDGTLEFPKVNGQLYLDLSRDFLFSPEGITSLMNDLQIIKERHGRISLVIFDPILRMMTGIDEYKATEVGSAVFAAASRIQTEIGSGVILVHHKGKGTAEGKSSYGSIAFHAFSENTLYILGDTPDEGGWVRVKGEYKSAGETTWAYRFVELKEAYQVEVTNEVEVTTGNPRGASRGIVDLLNSIYPDGMSVDELADAFEGTSQYMIRESLKQLESQKKVRRVKSEGEEGKKGGPRKDRWFADR